MPIDKFAKEMEGKILLLDNKKFMVCISVIGIYYMAFIGFLTAQIMQSGGFH